MANVIPTTQWDPKTFDWVRQNKDVFIQVAKASGIRPEGFVGAMAKEYNSYIHDKNIEIFKDALALQFGLLDDSKKQIFWSSAYDQVYKAGLIDAATTGTKLLNPILTDLGSTNFQGATAIGQFKKWDMGTPLSC